MTIRECRAACNELDRGTGAMKTGKACYIAQNGKCRQDGRQGSRTSLVCISRGNFMFTCV